MNPADAHAQFQRLLATARQVQARLLFLPTVAVGGTAAALYARHRVSLDVDFFSPYLRDKFDEVESGLREIPGFSLARLRRPVLILGSRHSPRPLTTLRLTRRRWICDSGDCFGPSIRI